MSKYEIDEQYDEQINLFDSIADDSDEKKILKKLAMAVNDQQNRVDIVDTVKDVIEKCRILENDDKSAKFVIKQIGKAQSFLVDALNHFDEETELEGIKEQLDSVGRLIQQLRRKVE
ncbi:hypothetical protein D3C74_418640 [compost metagenome]